MGTDAAIRIVHKRQGKGGKMSDYIDLPVIDAHMHIMDDFSKDPRSIMETIRDMHERNHLKACNLLSIPSIDDQQIPQIWSGRTDF